MNSRDTSTIANEEHYNEGDYNNNLKEKLPTVADGQAQSQAIPQIRSNQREKTGAIHGIERELYETLKAALLFSEKAKAQLKEWGFKINP